MVFLSRFQCVVTVLGCYFVHSLSVAFPERIDFPKPEISYRKLAKVRLWMFLYLRMHTMNKNISENV